MNHNKLSADPLALILGILALVIGLAGCCCYGITAIVPLAMAIIGLVTANKSLREFGENPEPYSPQSRSNVYTAKIINIIAIVLNSLTFLFAIAVFAIYGTVISAAVLKGLENSDFTQENNYNFEIESDSLNTWEDEAYDIGIEMDSVNIDSILK